MPMLWSVLIPIRENDGRAIDGRKKDVVPFITEKILFSFLQISKKFRGCSDLKKSLKLMSLALVSSRASWLLLPDQTDVLIIYTFDIPRAQSYITY